MSQSSPLPLREDGDRFLSFVDTSPARDRRSSHTSSTVIDAGNALVAALLRVEGLDVAEIRPLLLTLCAANQACSGERLPARLHLHVGPGAWGNPEPPQTVTLLRDLCAAAPSALEVLDDGACAQMLRWISEAWRARVDDAGQGVPAEGPSDPFAHSTRGMVAQSPDSSAAPRRVVWRDDGIPWRKLAQAADMAARTPMPRGYAPFFAVLDDAAGDAGLGRVSNAPAMAHRDRLVAALMAGQAVDTGLLQACLQRLELENKASCRETDPQRLHLYMGLGQVRRRDRQRAARFLQRLSVAVQAAKRGVDDRSSRQMLDWIGHAWQTHASLLQRAVPREHETPPSGPESAAVPPDAVEVVHASEASASEALRHLLLQKRIGKTQVKHLARLVHARAVTVGQSEAIEGDATPEQIRTMHKHLQKVIAHLSASAHADHLALHSLRYVHARLQQALEQKQ